MEIQPWPKRWRCSCVFPAKCRSKNFRLKLKSHTKEEKQSSDQIWAASLSHSCSCVEHVATVWFALFSLSVTPVWQSAASLAMWGFLSWFQAFPRFRKYLLNVHVTAVALQPHWLRAEANQSGWQEWGGWGDVILLQIIEIKGDYADCGAPKTPNRSDWSSDQRCRWRCQQS